MKILVLTNHSRKVIELASLTSPVNAEYCRLHGYAYQNLGWNYSDHVPWLQHIAAMLGEPGYDVVMTLDHDAMFVNHSISIEEKMGIATLPGIDKNGRNVTGYSEIPHEVIIARDGLSTWPINNGVMIWPKGAFALNLLERLIKDAPIWLGYRELWQIHLWNLMQREFKHSVRLVPPRFMNSTYQPVIPGQDASGRPGLARFPGESSFQLGDWIFHAVDMPYDGKIKCVQWARSFVGDGTYIPAHAENQAEFDADEEKRGREALEKVKRMLEVQSANSS